MVRVRNCRRLNDTDSAALSVPIRPSKNPAPPRYLPALPHAFLAARILAHALAGGFVLVLEMMVLRVVPTGAEFGLPRGLLFLSAADALLDSARGFAAAVAGRSPALGVSCRRGEEGEGEGWEEAELNHGAISRFLLQAKRCNPTHRLPQGGGR